MKKIIVLISILFIASCASVGVKKPGMATLQNQKIEDGTKSHALMFVKVDGKELKNSNPLGAPNKASYYITPGKKRLEIKATLITEEIDLVWAAKFDVQAELKENEIYKIRASEKNWCIKIEVVDSSNEVVVGPEFGKVSPFLSYNHMQNSYLMGKVKNILNTASCI